MNSLQAAEQRRIGGRTEIMSVQSAPAGTYRAIDRSVQGCREGEDHEVVSRLVGKQLEVADQGRGCRRYTVDTYKCRGKVSMMKT
jgi:hypothetical protein